MHISCKPISTLSYFGDPSTNLYHVASPIRRAGSGFGVSLFLRPASRGVYSCPLRAVGGLYSQMNLQNMITCLRVLSVPSAGAGRGDKTWHSASVEVSYDRFIFFRFWFGSPVRSLPFLLGECVHQGAFFPRGAGLLRVYGCDLDMHPITASRRPCGVFPTTEDGTIVRLWPLQHYTKRQCEFWTTVG